MDLKKEVNNFLGELAAGQGSSLYGALIMMRTTLIKSRDALTALFDAGCIPQLIRLLKDKDRHGNKTKTVDILLSILANLCMEEEVREKVMISGGLPALATATMEAKQESIHNRGVRAIANLAQDVNNCDAIFNLELPAFIAKQLLRTEDVECRSTYCRALRLLGQSSDGVRRLVKDTHAVHAIANLLKLDNRKLLLKAIRTLYEFSAKRCSPEFAGQMLGANVMEELVTLAEDDDDDVAFFSFTLILRLCEFDLVRPALGSAGAISLLVKLMDSERRIIHKVSALNALCLCCKEAVNRSKIRDAGGLEIFISALKGKDGDLCAGKFSVLYDRIISSLVNFLYNDDTLSVLLELGLVSVLVTHLQRCCQLAVPEQKLKAEITLLCHALQTESANVCGIDDAAPKSTEPPQSGSGSEEDEKCPIQLEEGGGARGVTVEAGADPDPLSIDVTELAPDTENNATSGSSGPRHTFSIHSPSYQSETAWRMEDFSSGVTCKIFTPDHDLARFSPTSVHSMLESSALQAPYSPLSAGASYYSPAQASPSHSITQSPYGSSPNPNVSGQASPVWSFSGSAPYSSSPSVAVYSPQQDSPQGSPRLSHFHQALGNLSPSSSSPRPPQFYCDAEAPSAAGFSSQASLFSQSVHSQEANTPFSERSYLNSPGQNHSYSAGDLVLPGPSASSPPHTHRFSVVPLSQNSLGSENFIFSASEDEDGEENETDKDGDKDCGEGSSREEKVILTDQAAGEEDAVWGKEERNGGKEQNSFKALSSLCHFKENCFKNSKIPAENETQSTATGDSPSVPDLRSTDWTGSKSLKHSINVASGQASLQEQSPKRRKVVDMDSEAGSHVVACASQPEGAVMSSVLTEDETRTASKTIPDARISTSDSHALAQQSQHSEVLSSKWPVFERTLSWPDKGKRPQSPRAFQLKKKSTLASSPFARVGVSPLHPSQFIPQEASRMVSDSPYRSPYPDQALSPGVKDGKKDGEIPETKFTVEVSCEGGSAEASPGTSGAAQSSSAAGAPQSGQGVNDERVKKIRRSTESNILILLSRISVKTNPAEHLGEANALNVLFCYLSCASNPMQRAVRTLHRLLSNPLPFQKLMLCQTPALVAKNLILDEDGCFPKVMFCAEWEDRYGSIQRSNMNLSDLLPLSQSSEASGSQVSEFGRRMDFEFGGDAYSKIFSSSSSSSVMLSSVGQRFRQCPSLSTDSEAARDSLSVVEPVYDGASASRAETRVRLGLAFIRTLGSVAMSRYGGGEIQHLLSRGSDAEKLACAISLLYLPLGWDKLTRGQFLVKHAAWDLVLPCLFVGDALKAREAIITAISLIVHLDCPAKQVVKLDRLTACPSLAGTPCEGKTEVQRPSNHCRQCQGHGAEKHRSGSDKNGNSKTRKKQRETQCRYVELSGDDDVHFLIPHVQGESRFHGSRSVLVQKSEVFAAMLDGGYAESEKSEIIVADVNPSGFEYVMHYLHGCETGCSVIDCLAMEPPGMEGTQGKDDHVPSPAPSGGNDKFVDGDNHGSNSIRFSFVETTNPSPSLAETTECVTETEGAGKIPTDSLPDGSDSEETDFPLMELTQSENSSDRLNIQECVDGASTSSNQIPQRGEHSEQAGPGVNVKSSVEASQRKLDQLLNVCVDVMTVADRFLLNDLVTYISSVLSHACLHMHTCEEIFYLATFYKLESLAMDAIRETLVSHTSRSEVAELYVDMAVAGYREQLSHTLDKLLALRDH